MKKDEFVEYYYKNYGEYPDQDLIDEYCNSFDDNEDRHYSSSEPSCSNYESNPKQNSLSSAADDVLSEVNSIFKNIARSARGSIKSKGADKEQSNYSSEFTLMLLIFLAKSSLYFLMRDSYDKGYDFSSM